MNTYRYKDSIKVLFGVVIILISITSCNEDDELPASLEEASRISRSNLSSFSYKRWNNQSLRDFIATSFPADVVNAYDVLKPLSYKADLGRFCLLYVFFGERGISNPHG